MTVRKIRRKVRKTITNHYTGNKLTHTAHPKTKKHIYANGEEDHRLHSHLIGPDKHKPGVGGKGNTRSGWVNHGQQGARMRKFRSAAAKLNAPKKAHGDYAVRSGRFADGFVDPVESTAFRRQMNFNLDNDEDKAQGSQNPWAQSTSISSLISGQLRQAANAPIDYAEQKQANLTQGSSAFNFGISGFNTGGGEEMVSATKIAQTNPMGAFGTSNVMFGAQSGYQAEESVEAGTFGGWEMSGVVNMFKDKADQDAYYIGDKGAKAFDEGLGKAWNDAIASGISPTQANADKIINNPQRARYANWFNTQQDNPQKIMDPKTGFGFIDNPNYKDPSKPTDPKGDNPDLTPQSGITPMEPRTDPAMPGTPTSGAYNPWAFGKGGEQNAYGPSQQTMNNATMDALSLANAYFAPQRTELAYELGDMETDMRRLATNLGRQVDDPVLQAKLYKEGMRAVRTLDVQQNTFAFQMADARRKEENQNFQFYDSLAQQEYQLWQANKQFTDQWNLKANEFNLNNWIAMENARNAGTGAPAPTAEGMEYQYSSAPSVKASTKPASGIYAKTRY